MKTLLSTKLLTPPQKELLLHSGLGLVHYNALDIEPLEVEIPLDCDNLIFTSQNTVRIFLDHARGVDLGRFNAFCVGEKTSGMLRSAGLKVVQVCDYAAELGAHIVASHGEKRFLFLCGRQRREVLPELFKKNNIRYRELAVYDSHPNIKAFDREFSGILCFSPMGIRSFLVKNSPGNSVLFCIGKTTAEEAVKHSKNIVIANRPTVENVLVQAINHFGHD